MARDTSDDLPYWLGRLLLLAGVVGLFLLLAARTDEMPHRWRVQILAHPVIWGTTSALLVAAGLRTLWRGAHVRADWSPTVPGRRFNSLVVYSRPGCCLCEDAQEVLAEYRAWLPPPVEVNIEEDPELLVRFSESIPVIECDGRIRFKGVVNESLLRRLIEGTPPLKSLRT